MKRKTPLRGSRKPQEGRKPGAALRGAHLAERPRNVSGAAGRAVPKPTGPARSPEYLEWVRRQACGWCGRSQPSHPHHHGPRGTGQKCSDYLVVPLCASDPGLGWEGCHEWYHRTGLLPNGRNPFVALGGRDHVDEVLRAIQGRLLVEWVSMGGVVL